jgi:hypothetical protein
MRAVVADPGRLGLHRGAVMGTKLKPNLGALTKTDFPNLVRGGQELGRKEASLPKPVTAPCASAR